MPRTVSNARYAATPDFQISDSAFDTQTAPVIAALSGGGFVAVWADVFFSTSTVRAQIFDRNGREVGAEFVVGQGPESIQPSVAALPTGGFVVGWTVGGPFPASFDIVGQMFDAAGATVGAQIPVNTTIPGFQVEPHVTALAGGGFVMIWHQPNDSTFDDVHGQVFAADGTKIGGEFVATDALPGDKLEPDVIGLAGGGFVVAWSQSGAETIGGNLSSGSRAQLFDASGNKVGAAFGLNPILVGTQQNPDLAALPNGGFVAVWADDGNSFGADPMPANKGIWAQIFDAGGAKIGAAVKVSALGPAGQNSPDVEIIAGVGFIVVWRDGNVTAEDSLPHMRAQILDFAGNKTGEEFSVNAGLAASQHLPDLTVLAGGALVVGWSNQAAPQFNNEDVRARIFFPTTLGTEGADTMAGTANRDFLFGLGGDDQIAGGAEEDGLYGGDGSDVLDGGGGADELKGDAGTDTLIGGLGNDTLDGGAGADEMDGGGGDDIFFVDSAGDRIVEAVGGGRDYVVSSVTYVLAAGAEVELISTSNNAGTAAINLTGNALANILVGNAGANVLDGGSGGADTLVGLGGDDTYFVDADDRVFEDEGGGYDYVVARSSFALGAGSSVELLSTNDNAGTAAINLTGNEFANVLVGNAGANVLDGGSGGADILVGLGGNDTYFVDADDRVFEDAGGGSDYLVARSSYVLAAGVSVELMSTNDNGGTAAIALTGNELANVLVGNAGANVLDGGLGNDLLVGLGGADTFRFSTAPGAGNVDAINDFVAGTDRIALDDAVFAAIGSPGALNPNAFFAGTAAHDADDRIVYDSATGQLFYDADGNGAGAQVLFATLTGLPVIAASDFQVI